MDISLVTLEGQYVRLEPITPAHIPGLWQIGDHAELWRYIPYTIGSEDAMRAYVTVALADQAAGKVVRWVTVARRTNELVGSTSFMAIDRQHRRVEIGGTWVTPAWQRSPINTEAKYLQLQHAFERVGCIRVELKTDALNTKSRRAIERIGAVQEGIFRNHMVMPGGRIRDSVYYGITREDWPTVKARLEAMMASYPPSTQS